MSFWYRIRHLRLEPISHQFKRRWYSQLSSSYFIAGAGRVTTSSSNNPKCSFISWRPNHLDNGVRFFAAPVQAKPKPETKDFNGPRLNNQITGEFVRLVGEEGHTVVSRREALDRARKLKLDLVEVQRTANPPVCKIMDFHREKYKKQVQEKERTKGKSELTLRKGDCKEVRFSGKTEQKDLQMKADTAKRLMEKGYRVKCMAMGTEDQDLGGFIARLSALIEDVAIIESGPRVEKKQAYVIVRHVKFGPLKNGPAKKVAKVSEPTKAEQGATSSTANNNVNYVQTSDQIEESSIPTESDSELEDDEVPNRTDLSVASLERTDKNLEKSRMGWSAFGANNDDFEKIFDVNNNGNGKTINSAYPQQVLQTMTTKVPPSPLIEPKVFAKVPGNFTQQKPDFGRPLAGVPPFRVQPPPSTEQNQQLGNRSSTYRPQLRQPPPPPARGNDEALKQGQGRLGTPTPPSPSYGIFSAPKAPVNPPPRSSNTQNSATEAYRQKQKTESGQRAETEEKKWGIFSSTTRESRDG